MATVQNRIYYNDAPWRILYTESEFTMIDMKKNYNMMRKSLLIFIGPLLLSLTLPLSGAQRPTGGMGDIDTIRKEILLTETDVSNYDSRRTALIRWWRLLWRQGYDLSSFYEVADKLLNYDHDSPQSWRAIEEGFAVLEAFVANPVRVAEVAGEPGLFARRGPVRG